jgi:quercetin dioxygenase-like cupin family protein
MHNRYTEQNYVLDGEFTVWTGGGRKTVLRRGDDIVIPVARHTIIATDTFVKMGSEWKQVASHGSDAK